MEDRKVKKIELLSPAGDLHRAKVAIDYGADAVYIGGQSFSLRSRASNFTVEDIREACSYAKAHGAAIHVTVNIVPHEEDFDGLEAYLKALENSGVKAIICASPAIMQIARCIAPRLEVHCSTQLSVTNSDAAKFLKENIGIDRVVLARECTMEQVREITENCGIETEAFIHGGMCVNYSGRCTLSNRMTLRDANRGGCAQSCRWRYYLYKNAQTVREDKLFTMGSKDLLSARHIAELIDAGVSSLKIEGRMKKEYYIASTISAYRKLIDEIYETGSQLSEERLAWHEKNIARSGNRETWDGFYQNETACSSIIYHEEIKSGSTHEILAKVIDYDEETKIATIESRNAFDVGDYMEILSPVTENAPFRIEWIENENGERVDKSRNPMDILRIPLEHKVRKEDILRTYRKEE